MRNRAQKTDLLSQLLPREDDVTTSAQRDRARSVVHRHAENDNEESVFLMMLGLK